MQIIKTYKYTKGKMVHDGYFIYGENQPLGWVALNKIERV